MVLICFGLCAVLDTLDRNSFVVVGKAGKVLAGDHAAFLFNERKHDMEYLTKCVNARALRCACLPADARRLRRNASVVIVAEKVGAIDDWLLLMGPEDPKVAKVSSAAMHACFHTMGFTRCLPSGL